MNFSHDQLRALDCTKSCFILASAGSGKTKVLTDRFVAAMINGIEPHRILCITFTNAAADEMKSRIASQLKALYLNEDGYTKKYLEALTGETNITDINITKAEALYFVFLNEYHRLRIMTVHSLCQQLLQRYPIEAGINPNFEIIDSQEANAMISEARNNIFTQNPNLINKATQLFSRGIFMNLIQSVDRLRLAYFREQHNNITEYHTHISNQLGYDAELSHESKIDEDAVNKYLTKTGTIRKKLNTADQAIAEKILIHITNNHRLKTINRTMVLLETLTLIDEKYSANKAAANLIDFNDILIKTHRLITSSQVSDFILQQLSDTKMIMMDEAQDLNSVQWSIVQTLAYDIVTDPTQLKTIFVVGDIKQSIYRFQGADHRLMTDFIWWCKKMLGHANKNYDEIILKECYRTNAKILGFVDNLFRNRGWAFDNHYCNHTTNNINPDSSVQFIKFDDIVPKIKSITETDNDQSVMVLSRSRNAKMHEMINRLRQSGINVNQSNTTKLYDHTIVMDIIAILELCIDNRNRYKVFCLAKSPYLFEEPLTHSEIA